METRLLQDWTTIRGTGATSIVQSASAWLDLEEFADATFWLDVREVTNPGAGSVSLAYETAPIKDDALFRPMTTIASVVVGTPSVSSVLLNASAQPLGRFVRWNLTGTQAGTWDVTFRIYVTGGVGAPAALAFSPLSLPKLLLWLRADKGIALNGATVSSWTDQSGNGVVASQGVVANQPTFVASSIGGKPSVNFAGATSLQNTITSLVGAGTPYSVLVVAKNGNGPLFTVRSGFPYSASHFYLSNTYVHGDGVNNFSSVLVANTLPETQSSTNAFKSCHRFKGAGVNPDIFLNKTQRPITSSGTYQTTESGAAGFSIGAAGGSAAYWNGLISEIIVTGNAISDSDRRNVEAYQQYFFGF